MSYKSARLLTAAVHAEMDTLRKLLMMSPEDATLSDVSLANGAAQASLIDLRKLVDELVAMADRPSIDDVRNLPPGEYVATMKPLVAKYHQQLMTANLLAQVLNEDLQANACVLVLMGDTKLIVRTAHDQSKPEFAIAVEALLASLDDHTKGVVAAGVAEAEAKLGIAEQSVEQEDDRPLRVKYNDRIQQEDLDRNRRAELVIDASDVVIKDRNGDGLGRKATQEEIDSCIVVQDPPGDES